MRIVIAGGTGLLGSALTRRLIDGGHDVVHLTRGEAGESGAVRRVTWRPNGSVGLWAKELDGADAIVNLAGAGIADRRWTAARKALLRSSRIDSTRSLVGAVQAATTRPRVFVQASGIGIYGATLDDRVLTEDAPPGDDFLGHLAIEWENEAKPVIDVGCRVVAIRTGLVLSREGGALPSMARPFQFFVGGPVGNGKQWMPWITIDDWVSLVAWAIGNGTVSGPLNAAAPAPVRNREFAGAIGRTLHRPSWMPVPAPALRLLLGEMAGILIGGQRAMPAKAQAHGFTFAYVDVDTALAHVLGPGRDTPKPLASP